MSRKDFELIARTLAAVRPDHADYLSLNSYTWAQRQWLRTVDKFANELAATNPRFNADRFRDACNA